MRKMFKKRRGMTLVELLGVMFVLAILAVIAMGGVGAARDRANNTSVQSDVRTYSTAIQQVVMIYPEIMKYTAAKPANAVEQIVGYVNEQLEEQWKFEVLAGATDSGGVATSTIKRDAWGNPYGLYIYFDDKATTYTNSQGVALKDSDSCLYLAIVSAGKNSTGGPVGPDGSNYNDADRKIKSAVDMVNNTDGVDDVGVIVRILNGDTYTATFGLDNCVLGDLKNIQWIYGVPSSTGGKCYDFVSSTEKTATTAGSIDKYYDKLQIKGANSKLFGTWS